MLAWSRRFPVPWATGKLLYRYRDGDWEFLPVTFSLHTLGWPAREDFSDYLKGQSAGRDASFDDMYEWLAGREYIKRLSSAGNNGYIH